ncbi:40S ribosomal protein S1-like [Nylanderia fulva]|uniref:40S ribosomal protein S1-like n=1 Tax=Nylanderia fulva TaxID=613905 RepID=UPI0010FB75D0|nr:40S ribosomal protein S1-like [Nylanderia fulva]
MAKKGGNSKGGSKKGTKKGVKRKVVDAFDKKEWYGLKVPSVFVNKNVGKTLISRISTKQNLEKGLVGRCFTVSQGDLNPGNEEHSCRKFKFIVDSLKGSDAVASFYGMELTIDKQRGIIRKWHTLIEGNVEVRTKDDYLLRVFVMGITKRRPDHVKKTCYATTAKVKKIRQRMFEIIKEEFSTSDIEKVMKKMCTEKVGKEIERQCSSIFPLQNCYTRKVKVLKRPKVEGEIEEVVEVN